MDWRTPDYPAFPTEESCPPEFEHIKGADLPVPHRFAWIVDPREQAAIVELEARRKAWMEACNAIHAAVVVPGWKAWRDDPDRPRTKAELAGFGDFQSPPNPPSVWEECNKIRKREYEEKQRREEAKQQRAAATAERKQRAAAGAVGSEGSEGLERGGGDGAFAVDASRPGVVWRQKLIDEERDALQQRDLVAEMHELPQWALDRLLQLSDNQITFLYFLCTCPLAGPFQELTRTRDNPRGEVHLWGYGRFSCRSAFDGAIPTAWKKWLLTPEGIELFAPIRTLERGLQVVAAEPAPEGLDPSYGRPAVMLQQGIYSFCHWGEEPKLNSKKDGIGQGRALVLPQMARLLKQELDPCFNVVRLHHQSLLRAVLSHPGYKAENEDVVHWFFYGALEPSKAPSGPEPEQWVADYLRLPGILRPPFDAAKGLHELPSLAQVPGWDYVDVSTVPRDEYGSRSDDAVQEAAWREFMDANAGTTVEEEDLIWRRRQHWPSSGPEAAELARQKSGAGWMRMQAENDQAWGYGHRLNFKLPKRPT